MRIFHDLKEVEFAIEVLETYERLTAQFDSITNKI